MQREISAHNHIFVLWQDLKKKHRIERLGSEFVLGFKAWLQQKDHDWVEHYSTETIIRIFISRGMGYILAEKDMEYYKELFTPIHNQLLDEIKRNIPQMPQL